MAFDVNELTYARRGRAALRRQQTPGLCLGGCSHSRMVCGISKVTRRTQKQTQNIKGHRCQTYSSLIRVQFSFGSISAPYVTHGPARALVKLCCCCLLALSFLKYALASVKTVSEYEEKGTCFSENAFYAQPRFRASILTCGQF